MMTEIKYIHLLRTEVISDALLLAIGYPYSMAYSQKGALVSLEMAQFVLVIAHLPISMEPTPLEKY